MKKIILLLFICTVYTSSYAHPGIGIVKDSKGNIYYTDLKQVWKVLPSGAKEIVVRNVHTHELYMDENDNLYGEHLWYNGEKLNTWGHYTWQLHSNGHLDTVTQAKEGFLDNYSFVRDRTGNMYWVQRFTTSKFMKRTPDGQVIIMAQGKFKDIRWMYATPEGTIYFIDVQDLYKLEQSGKFTLMAKDLASYKVSNPPGLLSDQHSIYGIWSDADENVYVAVLSAGIVKKITPDGNVTNAAYSTAPWKASSGVFDDKGNLWLMETTDVNQVRVRKVSNQQLAQDTAGTAPFIFSSRVPPLIFIALLMAGIITFIVLIIRGWRKKQFNCIAMKAI